MNFQVLGTKLIHNSNFMPTPTGFDLGGVSGIVANLPQITMPGGARLAAV